jgi:sulfonate transport system permease protein
LNPLRQPPAVTRQHVANVKLRALARYDFGAVRPRKRHLPTLRLSWIVQPLIIPTVVLIAWEVTAWRGLLPVQILPSPAQVASTFYDLVRDGEIIADLRISLWRITCGFIFGGVAGLALGAAMGASRTIEDYCGPLFRAFAQVPSLGWVPILILIFGLDEILKYLIIAKACFVPITLATAEGIRNVPRQYLEVVSVLRLSRRAALTKLLIPAALPTIFSGLRLGLSHAWIALIVVEMIAAAEGIGYMMVWGRTLFQIDIVIVGMIQIGVIGFLMDLGLTRLERRLRRWVPSP